MTARSSRVLVVNGCNVPGRLAAWLFTKRKRMFCRSGFYTATILCVGTNTWERGLKCLTLVVTTVLSEHRNTRVLSLATAFGECAR